MGGEALRIVSVGESTIDHYLDLRQEFIGGISLNFAVNAKRCGSETSSLVSRIGDDHGQRILARLQQEGVDSSHISVRTGATARQNIVLSQNGERIFPAGGYNPGPLESYRLNDSDIHFIQQHNVLMSCLFQQIQPLFVQLTSVPFNGWRVADFLDLSDYGKKCTEMEKLSDQLTIAFVSGDQELMESLRPLSRSTACLIVITSGAAGSVALVKGEPVFQPSLKVTNIVDSTGCGDAFQAAFTVSYWREGDVCRALECGSQQAARVLQHYGAIA